MFDLDEEEKWALFIRWAVNKYPDITLADFGKRLIVLGLEWERRP